MPPAARESQSRAATQAFGHTRWNGRELSGIDRKQRGQAGEIRVFVWVELWQQGDCTLRGGHYRLASASAVFPFEVDAAGLASGALSGYSYTPRPDFRPSLPAFTYCTSSGQGRNFCPRLLCRYSRMCSRVSSPTRSTSSNGPIGRFSPNFSALSISSAVAIPSWSM